MSGNKAGGLKTVARIKAKDPDYYKKLGARGGKASSGPDYQVGGPKASGFAAMSPERHLALSSKGGKLGKPSPRTKPAFTLRDHTADTSIQPNAAML